jgi:hypothetical protein
MNKIAMIMVFILTISCMKTSKRNNDPPIARVYDKYLYTSQLRDIVPKEFSVQDSQVVMKDHIDKWIRNQLLLFQAEQQLSPEEQNVEQQIEDYKSSLLIYKYQQNYLSQKLDTNVAEKEIEKYYNGYSSNFILNNDLIKGIFIQVPRNAPEIFKIRMWYTSQKPEHIKELEKYCFNYATKYNYFEEHWEYFSKVLNDLPEIYTHPDNILKYRKNYETKDSSYYYFLKISDYRLEGTIAPIEFIKKDIKNILITKRKMQLIQELESEIYNDALNRGNFVKY